MNVSRERIAKIRKSNFSLLRLIGLLTLIERDLFHLDTAINGQECVHNLTVINTFYLHRVIMIMAGSVHNKDFFFCFGLLS